MFNREACVNGLAYFQSIRPDMLDAMDRWAKHGIPGGDFLMAVMRNDLMDAVGRADQGNRRALYEICCYVYNELPSGCHGSAEIVEQWKGINSDNSP